MLDVDQKILNTEDIEHSEMLSKQKSQYHLIKYLIKLNEEHTQNLEENFFPARIFLNYQIEANANGWIS